MNSNQLTPDIKSTVYTWFTENLSGILDNSVTVDIPKPEKPNFKYLKKAAIWSAIIYILILAAVLTYVFISRFGVTAGHVDCNNHCMLLIVVLLLATAVLAFVINSVSNIWKAKMDRYYMM